MIKLWNNIKSNNEMKIFFIIIITFFVTGIVIGVNSFLYNSGDNNMLQQYMNAMFTNMIKSDIEYNQILLRTVIINASLFGLIFLFGNTKYGSPIIIMIMMIRGYFIGYSFTLFIKLYSVQGLSLALSGIIPHNLIFIPVYILLATIAAYNSYVKLKDKFSQTIKIEFSNKLTSGALIIAIPVVIGVLIQSFLTPNILKMVVTKIFI